MQKEKATHFDILFKYIMVGNVNCGKTSLLGRFLKPDQKWTDHYEPTLGLEFGSKTIRIKQKLCKIMVWDTAGQEIFRSIIRSYYKGAIVCLLIFDITDHNSFESCREWLEQVKANSHSQLKIYLIGNKCDLSHNRGVSEGEAEELVEQMSLCRYIEVSSKDNINIAQIFSLSVEDILTDLQENKICLNAQQNIGIKINQSSNSPQLNKNVSLNKTPSLTQSNHENCSC